MGNYSPEAEAANNTVFGSTIGTVLQEASKLRLKVRKSGVNPATGGVILVLLGLSVAAVSIVCQHRWEDLDLSEVCSPGLRAEVPDQMPPINKDTVRSGGEYTVARMWSSLRTRTAEASSQSRSGHASPKLFSCC